MKRFFLIWSVCVPIMLVAQQWHTTLDVLRPAKHRMPMDVHNLLVVNNTVQQPLAFGHSVKVDGYVAGNVEIDLEHVTRGMLFAVTAVFDDSGIFDNVGLLDISQNNTGTFYQLSVLPQEKVAALCQDYASDALLVCNRNLLLDVVESFPLEEGDYYALLTVYEKDAWVLQYPDGRNIHYIQTDTLYWEAYAYSREQALAGLPDRQTALTDMAKYVGERFATTFIPQWETVDRYLYENNNATIERGMWFFTRQRWDEAIAAWEKAYEDKDKKTSAYAAADIAVAFEILGNLDAALLWAEHSMNRFFQLKSADALQQKVNMTYYMQQLRIRKQEQTQLL